jgi:uracil-DNA glycosylase family 4
MISRRLNRPSYDREDYEREYDLFLILSGPGMNDDMAGGIGFDPQFEKLIDLVLKAGFDKDKVFVSYITRCSPPPKRKPTVQEIKACSDYIKDELKLTKPKVVMPLGAIPLRLFNLHNRGGINKIRGTVFNVPLPTEAEDKAYTVLPTIDPGFFNYNSDPNLERRVLEDYRKAYALSNNLSMPSSKIPKDFTLLDTLGKIDQFVDEAVQSDLVAFDTESRSLPWSREPLTTFSFCIDPDKAYVLPVYEHDPNGVDWKLKKFWTKEEYDYIKKRLADIFEDPKVPKSAHNDRDWET